MYKDKNVRIYLLEKSNTIIEVSLKSYKVESL